MKLPTQTECSELFTQYKTPANVVDHSKKVNQVAIFLAQKLKENDVDINIDLVDKASLLHDLVRIPEQVSDPAMKNMHHAYINYEILKNNYPELAKIVREHRMDAWLNSEVLDTWEKKVVNYADKRVNNEQIVSIEDRMRLGKERWHIKPEDDKTEKILENIKKIEKQIFDQINLKPEGINEI
ncbi:HD domain-containing protein [Patescibacteria group bacterium]|nr:HD domain-containing protein [Patescibacteria group bacterium]MBU1673391.1 HD domain-containing protein [Patescibacteria group bacterium]MBU1963283.1 HD domain-containing protein [Patescibacteria group bacterium]